MTQEHAPIPLKLKLRTAVAIDYPQASEILVSFPEEWEVVGQIRRENSTLYIAGLPASQEQPRRDRFYGLPAEVNLALTQHRLYRLFLPWPQPSVLVGWDEASGTGRVLKLGDVKVQLQPIGQAQAWFGASVGLIWECYLFEAGRKARWQEELAAFWRAMEGDLGVAKLCTPPHEPTFEEGYTDFLGRLGYAPDPEYSRWWSKNRWRYTCRLSLPQISSVLKRQAQAKCQRRCCVLRTR